MRGAPPPLRRDPARSAAGHEHTFAFKGSPPPLPAHAERDGPLQTSLHHMGHLGRDSTSGVSSRPCATSPGGGAATGGQEEAGGEQARRDPDVVNHVRGRNNRNHSTQLPKSVWQLKPGSMTPTTTPSPASKTFTWSISALRMGSSKWVWSASGTVRLRSGRWRRQEASPGSFMVPTGGAQGPKWGQNARTQPSSHTPSSQRLDEE